MTSSRSRMLLLSLILASAAAVWHLHREARPRVLVGASRAGAGPPPPPAAESPVVLLDPAGSARWEAELLATYGFPGVPRVASPALARARHGRRERWVVVNAELEDATRAALRARVRAGAWVVELGPRPAVCGAVAGPGHATREIARIRGQGLDRARWPVAVAALPGCTVQGCGAATLLARVESGDAPNEGLPLVIREHLGDGACTRWLGDLGQAVQRLRQGDPRRAVARGSADRPFKPADLFAGDLEPGDYALPSADRLGFALAAQIAATPGPDVLVSPLPAGSRGLLVFTADQDYVPGPGVLAQSAALGSAGWTVTLTTANVGGEPDVVFRHGEQGLIALDLVSDLAARGHEVGVHPNLNGLPLERYGEVLAQHVAAFTRAYGVAPRIVRNHHVLWSGYAEMARLQANAGLALNLDFVTAADGTGYHPGFMTGSGLPMPFVDERGAVLPILQQATQIDDYLLIPSQAASREEALAALIAGARALLAASRREHVPLTLLHHPAWWYETGGAWQKEVLREAARHGMEVWGAGRFLAFVQDARASRVRARGAGFDLVMRAPAALLVEGAQTWSVDGELQAGALTRTLAGTTYVELALPQGELHVQGH